MTILVVDDSSLMRTIMIRSLGQAGFGDHEIAQAQDGAEGLATALALNPSVILSDWNMPNMDGLEFLTALRGAANATPFGFVTSESTLEKRAVANAAGADFVLSKPFTTDDLIAHLTPHL